MNSSVCDDDICPQGDMKNIQYFTLMDLQTFEKHSYAHSSLKGLMSSGQMLSYNHKVAAFRYTLDL